MPGLLAARKGDPHARLWRLTGVWAAGSCVRPFRACGSFRAVTGTQRWDAGRGRRLRTSCPRCFLSDPNVRPLRLHTELGPARGPAAARPGEGRCPRVPVALLTGDLSPTGSTSEGPASVSPRRTLHPTCPSEGAASSGPGPQPHHTRRRSSSVVPACPAALAPLGIPSFPLTNQRCPSVGLPAWDASLPG